MKKWVAAVLASSITSATAADLLEVFNLARSRDPVYATARATWAAAQEKIPQGRALLLPAISASANTNYNDRDIAFRNGTSAPGRFNSNGYTVAPTLPLEDEGVPGRPPPAEFWAADQYPVRAGAIARIAGGCATRRRFPGPDIAR